MAEPLINPSAGAYSILGAEWRHRNWGLQGFEFLGNARLSSDTYHGYGRSATWEGATSTAGGILCLPQSYAVSPAQNQARISVRIKNTGVLRIGGGSPAFFAKTNIILNGGGLAKSVIINGVTLGTHNASLDQWTHVEIWFLRSGTEFFYDPAGSGPFNFQIKVWVNGDYIGLYAATVGAGSEGFEAWRPRWLIPQTAINGALPMLRDDLVAVQFGDREYLTNDITGPYTDNNALRYGTLGPLNVQSTALSRPVVNEGNYGSLGQTWSGPWERWEYPGPVYNSPSTFGLTLYPGDPGPGDPAAIPSQTPLSVARVYADLVGDGSAGRYPLSPIIFRPSYRIPPTVVAVGVNYWGHRAVTNLTADKSRIAPVIQSSYGRLYGIPDNMIYLAAGTIANGQDDYFQAGFDYFSRDGGIVPVSSLGMATAKIGFARVPSLQTIGDPIYPQVTEAITTDVPAGWQSIATPDVPSDLPGGLPGNYAQVIG
jgi:hypothetical protein